MGISRALNVAVENAINGMGFIFQQCVSDAICWRTKITMGENVYIHKEIQKAVLPLLEKYDLELIDLIGEMAHAMHIMASFKKEALIEMVKDLE